MMSKCVCRVEGCFAFSVTRGLCSKHYMRQYRHGSVTTRSRRPDGTGTIRVDGYHETELNGTRVCTHRAIAASALGRPLPKNAQVHHIDENKLNNAHTNLVICPDGAYHKLLHQRQRALNVCGYADWRKCPKCQTYDDTDNMRPQGNKYIHAACRRKYEQQRALRLKQEKLK
jgi:hypothetical protein